MTPRENIMAESTLAATGNSSPAPTVVGAEAPAVNQQVTRSSRWNFLRRFQKPDAQVVKTNALLSDEERLKEVRKSLGVDINPQQEQAVTEAHKVGINQPGNNRQEVGVYNYTPAQIREKAEILKQAGFNKEQRRTLMEVGLVGVLPAADFSGFDKTTYTDTPLEPIVEELMDIGTSDGADETFLKETVDRVRKLVDSGAVKYSQAKDLIKTINQWRIKAEKLAPEAEPAIKLEDLLAEPEWLKKLGDQASDFQRARVLVESAQLISRADFDRLSPQQQTELRERFTKSKDLMDILLAADNPSERPADPTELAKYNKELERRIALRDRILHFVRQDIRRVYLEATQGAPRIDSDTWGVAPPQKKSLKDKRDKVQEELANYDERFWEYGEETLREIFGPGVDIATIKKTYQGVANYLAAKVAISIDKELVGEDLHPNNVDSTRPEFADDYLTGIKNEIEAEKGINEERRRKRRKRATAAERLHYNDWREKFDFRWAETADELNDCLDDWLDYFDKGLPRETEEAVYNEVTKGVTNVLSSLEQARNRLGIETNSITAQRLREKAQGWIYTIAGARFLESKGGFEYFIKLRNDFASNYNAYFDGVYKAKGSAIMADILSEDEGAIYRGGPRNLKKPLTGDTSAYRARLEREAIRYCAAHELYVADQDFEEATRPTAEDRKRIIEEANESSLTREDVLKKISKDVQRFSRRYGWGEDDPIEELLLHDKRGEGRWRRMADGEEKDKAEARWRSRIKTFNDIKEMLDKIDITDEEKAAGITTGLDGLSEDARRERIRSRIRTKIKEENQEKYLDEVDAMPDQAAQDKALWQWVLDYNNKIQDQRETVAEHGTEKTSNLEPWFPSSWDEERLSIQRPEDIIDRALSKEQFRAMVEEIEDPYKGMTEKQIRKKMVVDFHQQVQEEVKKENLSAEEEAIEINKLLRERNEYFKSQIEDALFKKEERESLARRNFNINVSQDKFMEFAARWGGLTTRVVNKDGDVVLQTVYSMAEEILKAKIDKEAAEVEKEVQEWLVGFATTHPGLTPQQLQEKINTRKAELVEDYPKKTPQEIDSLVNDWVRGYRNTHPAVTGDKLAKAITEQRRLFRRHKTFAAVLGLREKGIAGDLPIWNYFYYGDVSQIGAFAELVGYTDDDKGELPELLDRGRKEMEAVFHFLSQLHMDGRILDVKDRDSGLIVKDKNGKIKPAHEERWVRPRVINAGGPARLRDLFETQFMVSTSGGVEVTDLISKIGNLGVWDEAWENGCKDKREWQGFRKGRCRWDAKRQSFFNDREQADPLAHVSRLAGAANARKFLVGGEIKGEGNIAGLLIEPLSGAYKYRDAFYNSETWLASSPLKNISLANSDHLKAKVKEELEKYDTDNQINPIQRDKLVEIGAGIMKPLIDYMNARKYLMNRAGLAPKNWKYDNELIVNAYFNELFNEAVMGSENLDYAQPGRSPLAIKIYKGLLQTSSYHILIEKDHKVIYPRAEETKQQMEQLRVRLAFDILPPAVKATAQQQMFSSEIEPWERTRVSMTNDAVKRLGRNPNPADVQRVTNDVNNQINAEIARVVTEGMKTVNKDRVNQQINKELHRQFQQNPYGLLEFNLPVDVLTMINNRKNKLINLHTEEKTTKKTDVSSVEIGTNNIEAELKRLIDYHIDITLHKEFVGEWPARLKES